MNQRLRILHLDDEPDFSSLVSSLLEKERLDADIVLVTDLEGFAKALDEGSFDVILADYTLPSCNGLQALEITLQKCPEVPFLLLSGAIGEHAAIDSLRADATDYVMKSYLDRLAPAIRRAVHEAQERSQLRHAEADAREGEMKFRVIFETSPVCMWVSNLQTGAFLDVNQAAIRRYGFTRPEFLSLTIADLCSPEEAEKLKRYQADIANKGSAPPAKAAMLCQHRTKGGTLIDVEITCSTLVFNGCNALLTIAHDVTEFRRTAEALKRAEALLAAPQRLQSTPAKRTVARKHPSKKSPRSSKRRLR
jgi:PAS domain S-box-containing protein